MVVFRFLAYLLFSHFGALVLATLSSSEDDFSDTTFSIEIDDFLDLRDEAVCPSTPGEVSQRLRRYEHILSGHGLDLSFWDPFDTIDELCRTGVNERENGLHCGCIGHGLDVKLHCPAPLYWLLWQRKVSWDICMLSCNCRQPNGAAGSSTGYASVGETNEAVEKGTEETTATEKKKTPWAWAWGKTKKLCGVRRCHGSQDCAGMSCGPTICRVVPIAPGVFDNLGACVLPSSVLGVLGSSSLGGRSVGDEACPCNSTYVSNQCCWADTGLVWEDADAKLGRLKDSDL